MRKRTLAACLSSLAFTCVCWAGSRSLRDELKQLRDETGFSVAMFDHGKLSTAPTGSALNAWEDVNIPGALGHSWSPEGMLSPDGSLAAFPYWEVDPCPSRQTCDVGAGRHYFLAIVPTGGIGVLKFPQIILPSEMCWTRDNSKLALLASSESNPHRQLIVVHLDSRKVERMVAGDTVALTPQCWSHDGRQLVYFAGEKTSDGPGTIRILDTATQQSRDLLRGGVNCGENSLCAEPYPTWSPDGEWIAYFQKKAYWAVRPSGDGKKKLFRRSKGLSPLQWSPDMRHVLYADCCALRDTLHCMCEIGRIHVRRLMDDADIEISGDGYQDMYVPRWIWIQKSRSEPAGAKAPSALPKAVVKSEGRSPERSRTD